MWLCQVTVSASHELYIFGPFFFCLRGFCRIWPIAKKETKARESGPLCAPSCFLHVVVVSCIRFHFDLCLTSIFVSSFQETSPLRNLQPLNGVSLRILDVRTASTGQGRPDRKKVSAKKIREANFFVASLDGVVRTGSTGQGKSFRQKNPRSELFWRHRDGSTVQGRPFWKKVSAKKIREANLFGVTVQGRRRHGWVTATWLHRKQTTRIQIKSKVEFKEFPATSRQWSFLGNSNESYN